MPRGAQYILVWNIPDGGKTPVGMAPGPRLSPSWSIFTTRYATRLDAAAFR